MARPKKTTRDPLIEAMISRLPAAGEDFSEEDQAKWIEHMRSCLSLVYGGDMARPLHYSGPPLQESIEEVLYRPSPPSERAAAKNKPNFYIGDDNLVRNKKGDRLMPNEISGTIIDLRGVDGDPDIITWADDSKGLRNAGDVTISL